MKNLLRISILVLVAVIAIAAGYLTENSPIGERVELATYDLRLRLRGSLPFAENSPITILGIDPLALDKINTPLIFWPQEIARVTRRLTEAGASVVGIDFMFHDLRPLNEGDNQRQLTEAILQAGMQGVPIVMGYEVAGREVEQLPLDLSAAALVNADFAQVPGHGKAYVNLTTDPDDFVRRQELYSTAEDGTEADGFAYAIARAHLKMEEIPFVALSDGTPGQGSTDPERTLMINFRGLDHFPQLSLYEVWKEDYSPQVLALLKDRIVLIGMVNQEDRHATPLYHWMDLQLTRGMRRTPGVYIHASVVATLLESEFISRPGQVGQMAALISVVLLTSLVCFYFSPLKAISISLALVLLFCLASYLAFTNGIWMNMVGPILGAFLALAGTQAANYDLEGKDKRALRGLFRRYVHDQVIEQILANPNLSLAGERKRITVLFADIRNFTTRSEGARAEDLVSQLNRYFERMVTAIQNHQGAVDKFMGDGIMALFGAPLEDEDSALHSVRAGQAMLHSLDRLNSRFEAEGIAPMRMGIGLHTGEAIVGNIGSSQRMEYTAIGDVVNTASRVEGLNKAYKTSFLITRDTFNALDGRFFARYIADVPVKGRVRPVPLFELDWQQQEQPPGTVKLPEDAAKSESDGQSVSSGDSQRPETA